MTTKTSPWTAKEPTYTVRKQSNSQRPEDQGIAAMVFKTYQEASDFVAANYGKDGMGTLYISTNY